MPLAMITWLNSEGRPDNSLPEWSGPVDPGYGHGHPKPPGSIGTLPVFPFDPSRPDNTLPGGPPVVVYPPIQLHPGLRLVVKWVACVGFVGVPDNSLPETPEPK